ncbi:MAG TPA: outer membrane beta-barrel protein [Longimicrobium sp.]|nr:outer membrane beta-barrel protein [Longimicrobium sp.]
MIKKTFAGLAAAAATLVVTGTAQAQIPAITPFSFEVRGGAAIPTGDLSGDRDAEPGLALGATATLHFIPLVGVYGGYSRAQFGAGGDGEYTDQGIDVGLRLGIPTPLIPIDPWIKAGLTYHSLEASGFTLPVNNFEADASLGYEVGAGLGFGFGPLSLTPGISWVSYDYDAGASDERASFVRVDIGARVRL